MIYFLSFQSILPINDEYTKTIAKEGFENPTPTSSITPIDTMSQAAKDSEFEKKITSNLTGSLEVTPPPKTMLKMDMNFGTDEALGIAVTPSPDVLNKLNNINSLTPSELLELLKLIKTYPQKVKVDLLSKIPALKIISVEQRLQLLNQLDKLSPEEQLKIIQPYISKQS
jgi:hypothetical protein